jgi:glycosyltransferase involved in cell wall biosynthesis
MPVHNALPHLDAAVESILAQTAGDFEFLILDDASTDGSTERLREWASRDARIRLVESKRRLGPAKSSQRVAATSTAPIVARMDADDISHPDRLREEIAVFDRHPEAGVVASLCNFIDANGARLRSSEAWRLSVRSPFVPFAHGAMMYRREIFDKAGGYRAECAYWEDQDLVTRMAAQAPVMVIPRPLYDVRLWLNSTRAASDREPLEQAVDLAFRCIDRLEENESYEDLLEARGRRADKVDPRVFISLGSQALWAGGRPKTFRRLLTKGRLGFDKRTLAALIWTAWASASPGTLRTILRLRGAAKNRLAKPQALPDGALVWRQR